MAFQILLGHLQALLEIFRRIVPAAVVGGFLESGIIVPSDGDVGEIGKCALFVQAFPLLSDILQDLEIILLHVDEMGELVVGDAIESQVVHQFRGGAVPHGIHAGDIHLEDPEDP